MTNEKWKFAGWIVLVIFLDQVFKFLVVEKNLFVLNIVKNSGLPFGINLPGFFNLFVVLALFFGFVILYLRYLGSDQGRLSFALIAGGAVSNILDRIVHGAVIDFLDVGIATLNLADISIWAGIGLFLIHKS